MMKKITYFLFVLFSCWQINAQVNVVQNFDSGTSLPAGWTQAGGMSISSADACSGNSIRDNLYTSSPSGTLTSPNQVAVVNATDLTFSFDYKIENFNSTTATPAGWGSAQLQYSVDNGTTWTTFYTINDSNHVVSNTCATVTQVITNGTIPVGSDFKFRFSYAWTSGDWDFYVDNISVKQLAVVPPICTALAVPANGATGVTNTVISWPAAAGAPTGYKLSVGTTSGGTDVLNMVDVGDVTSYDMVSLLSATTYYVTVVPYNAIGDATGCVESSFATCGDLIAPFSEGFENGGSIPNCWSMSGGENWQFSNAPGSNNIGNSGTMLGSTPSGNYFAWVDDSGTPPNDVTLTTPPINIAALTAPRIVFYEISDNQSSNANATLNVEVWDGAAWNLMGTYNTNTIGWEKKIINLNTLTITGNIKIRFIILGSTSFYDDIAIDDVTVQESPSCVEPANLVGTNVTSNSIDLSWTDPTGFQFDFEYIVQPQGTGVPTVSGTAVSDTSAIAGSLTGNTFYEVWVRANCGTEFSDWTGPVYFKTLCSAYTAPWTYDVENAASTTVAVIADCWSTTPTGSSAFFRWNVNSSATTPTSATGPSGPYGGTRYFYTEGSSGTTGDVAELYSASVDINALTTPSLQFYYHMYGSNMGELHVDVYDGTNWVNDVDVTIGQQQVSNADLWKLRIVDLSSYTGTIQVRFRAIRGNGGNSDIAIDDISFVEAPTCFPVTNIAVNYVTDTTLGLSWTANGTATSWNIEYGPVGFTPGTGTVVAAGTNPYVLGSVNPLTPDTSYEFYIQSDCGAGDLSSLTGPVSFKTFCSPTLAPYVYDVETAIANTASSMSDCWSSNPSSTSSLLRWDIDGSGSTPSSSTGPAGANSGVKYFYLETTSGQVGDEAELYSPLVNITSLTVPTLQFYYHMYGSSMGDLHVDIFNGTSWVNDFYIISGQQQTSQSDPWALQVLSLDTFTGTIQVRFRGTKAGSFGDISLDDISIVEAPSCLPATNVVVSNVTNTQADVSWDDMSAVSQFDYQYVIQASGTGEPTAAGIDVFGANTVTDNTLTPNTNYEVWVRANCGADFSTWTGPVYFKTECDAFTVPYFENFDAYISGGSTNPNVPDCWTNYDGGAGFCYIGSSFAYSAPRSYYMNNSSDTSGDYMLISPNTISLSSGLNRTRFFARSGSNGYEVQVGTMTDKTDPTTFTLISTIALTNVHTQYVVSIPTGTDQYLVFRHGLGGTYRTLYLDDIIVEAIPTTSPTCLTTITATPDAACGNFATSLAWDHVSGADGYKLNVGTTPGGTDVYNALDLGFVTNYSFSGSYNTTYYYTVVPYNANGDATGCMEMSFTTAVNGCYCTSVPTSNDGNGITNVLINTTNVANPDVTYADYTTTGTPEVLEKGTTLPLFLTFETSVFTYAVNIWIDFNDDFNFDASELVQTGIQSSNVSPNTLDASFLVPTTGIIGNHRMRIASADSGQSTPNPCYSGSYGVTLDFTVNVIENLSTSTFVNDTFKVYPNPVRDILNLEYNSEITNVKVINLIGQVVINSDINATTTQIDMSQLNAGTYLVNVTIGDIVKTVKVVKQ